LNKRPQVKELAKERITILIANALKERDDEIADKQAKLARKIAMRFRIRLPYEIRQLFCKKCKAFMVPGKSSRVRIGRANTKAIRITCLRCGHTYRKILATENKDL
jgi:ribonuclease P protein subunit RPR2